MKTETISVIVPIYNIQNYIEKAVESIQKQTYKYLEIILVDDGSTDDSLNVIKRIAENDERVIVVSKEHSGVTSTRLHGVSEANGEWIGFMDGDDHIDPDMYERLIDNAHKYDADISHCGYQMVFPSKVDYYYNTGRVVEQDNLTGVKDLLEGSFIEPGLCNKIYRSSLFKKIFNDELMDLSIKNTEDLLMNYYLFRESKKSIFEDFCPYHYILRKGSASTSVLGENKLRDPLKVKNIIFENTKDSEVLNTIALKLLVSQLIWVSGKISGENKEIIKKYRKKAVKDLRSMLPDILKSGMGVKLKFLSLWISIWPALYRCARKLYDRMTGKDKKYEVK